MYFNHKKCLNRTVFFKMFVIHNYNPNFLSYKKLLGIDLAVLPRPACRKAKIGEQRDAGTARFFMCAGSFRLLLRKIHLPPRGRLTMPGGSVPLGL